MAKSGKKVDNTSTSSDSPNDTGENAFKDPSTDPDTTRGDSKDRVGEEVKTSFDERTGVTQPFVKEDGTQDNGAPDLEENTGARRASTREGDKTTVEETETAIEEGTVEGNQSFGTDEDDQPKNPVATESNTGKK